MLVLVVKGIHIMSLMVRTNIAFHELSACAALPATSWALTCNKQLAAMRPCPW